MEKEVKEQKNTDKTSKQRQSMIWYFYWPLILAAIMVVATVLVFLLAPQAGGAVLTISLAVILISLVLYFTGRTKLKTGLLNFADHYDTSRQKVLESIPLGTAICDLKGNILWENRAFHEINIQSGQNHQNILELFPDLTAEMLKHSDERIILHSSCEGRRYRLELIWKPLLEANHANIQSKLPIEADADSILLTAADETELVEYRQKYNDSRACIGLISLDNYDEALGSVDEVRQSLLTALVDRKLSNYFGSMNGIVKKFEIDKYLLFIQDNDMAKVLKDRFSVLEDVKTINIGNSLKLTLSIGVGMRGESYNAIYEEARKALDLALGRGGDQAVVSCDGETSYFGGKSSSTTSNTKVRARVKAQAFREILDTKDKVIVMGHKNADVDALGASAGVWRIATSLGKKAYLVNGNTEVSVQPFKERFIESPDYPEDFFISAERALELADDNTLIVLVDVNRPSYAEAPGLLKDGRDIVVIDHHRMGTETVENPVLSYVEPFASSASEMVAELIQYVDAVIDLKPLEADTMYGGIILDTQNFTVQTGVRTFEAAAFLKRKGADPVRVRKMFRDELNDYKAKAQALGSATLYRDHFMISVIDPKDAGSPTIIGAQAANSLLEINGIKAAIVLTPIGDKIFISARSIDEVNVQVLMEKLGGGGHKSVAGAQLTGVTVEEAIKKVTDAIDEMIEEGEVA